MEQAFSFCLRQDALIVRLPSEWCSKWHIAVHSVVFVNIGSLLSDRFESEFFDDSDSMTTDPIDQPPDLLGSGVFLWSQGFLSRN